MSMSVRRSVTSISGIASLGLPQHVIYGVPQLAADDQRLCVVDAGGQACRSIRKLFGRAFAAGRGTLSQGAFGERRRDAVRDLGADRGLRDQADAIEALIDRV